MVSQVGGITPTYPSGVSRHADVRGLTDRTRFLGPPRVRVGGGHGSRGEDGPLFQPDQEVLFGPRPEGRGGGEQQGAASAASSRRRSPRTMRSPFTPTSAAPPPAPARALRDAPRQAHAGPATAVRDTPHATDAARPRVGFVSDQVHARRGAHRVDGNTYQNRRSGCFRREQAARNRNPG